MESGDARGCMLGRLLELLGTRRSVRSYSIGTLYKNVLTDESGHRVVEFKDKQGHTILKRVAKSTSATDGHTGSLCTYYVYDDLNQLRFVISPWAVEYLQPHGWTLTQAIADALCFQYTYDARIRMTLKQVPGAEEEEMVCSMITRL